MSNATLYESNMKSLPFLHRGKVRDNYAVGNDKMLIVASDRLSAFDVVLPEPIPGKGEVLNEMANFWFERLGHIVPNHLTGIAPSRWSPRRARAGRAAARWWCKKLKPLPVEAVVRGYIIGSRLEGLPAKPAAVCGIALPPACSRRRSCPSRSSRPPPRPSRRPRREHQFRADGTLIGAELAAQVREVTHPALQAKPPTTRRHAASSSPTPSSNSASTTTASCT